MSWLNYGIMVLNASAICGKFIPKLALILFSQGRRIEKFLSLFGC